MTDGYGGPSFAQIKDGPAQGLSFTIARSPTFLRIVKDQTTGEWDCLDQLHDVATDSEDVYVYRQTSWSHVRAVEKDKSGFYTTYQEIPINTATSRRLKNNRKWRAWVDEQVKREANE